MLLFGKGLFFERRNVLFEYLALSTLVLRSERIVRCPSSHHMLCCEQMSYYDKQQVEPSYLFSADAYTLKQSEEFHAAQTYTIVVV